MKEFSCVILALLMIFSLFACGEADASPSNTASDTESSKDEFYRDHQQLTASKADFDADAMLRVDIPEVGLENVYIRQVTEKTLLDTDIVGRVYLIGDDRYGGSMGTSDFYLLVTANDKLYIKDLSRENLGSASMGGTLYFADFDGDKDEEIILHEAKGMSGGAGQYLARVFDFTEDGIKEIFTSYDEEMYFNTGFTCKIMKDKKLRVDNNFTGYTTTFEVIRKNEEYFTGWYDEDGNPKDIELWVDSFNRFEPEDTDGDGISEILCRQYTCLYGHTDYIGDAVSVLKYDNDTNKFYVVDAWFEPADR